MCVANSMFCFTNLDNASNTIGQFSRYEKPLARPFRAAFRIVSMNGRWALTLPFETFSDHMRTPRRKKR